MPKLPVVTGGEAIGALQQAGFNLARVRSSHHILKRDGHPNLITVPVHGSQSLKPGLLRAIIRDAGLTVEEFCALLQE